VLFGVLEWLVGRAAKRKDKRKLVLLLEKREKGK
jgi:hypothetical protein